MSYKVPYRILALEVDKLYPPHYVLKKSETLEQHLEDINEFIEACGWTVQEYIEEYIHDALKDWYPSIQDMN